jgi:hypothetical protein
LAPTLDIAVSDDQASRAARENSPAWRTTFGIKAVERVLESSKHAGIQQGFAVS